MLLLLLPRRRRRLLRLLFTLIALKQPVDVSAYPRHSCLAYIGDTGTARARFTRRRVCVHTQLQAAAKKQRPKASDAPANTDRSADALFLLGKQEGYRIVAYHPIPPDGLPDPSTCGLFNDDDVMRLGLTPTNMTLPSALMILDPDRYGTLSRALRACRDGSVLVHRGQPPNDDGGSATFDVERCKRGRVGDRVTCGDVVAIRERIEGTTTGAYCARSSESPPALRFELPVVYEDDHVAIVNKPGGVSLYPHKNLGGGDYEDHDEGSRCSGGGGIVNTVRDALPLVLKAPRDGTDDVLWRPEAAHRLDKATSGLLVVAKTKPALVGLSGQFARRYVAKTYAAICWGRPSGEGGGKGERSLLADEAKSLGTSLGIFGVKDGEDGMLTTCTSDATESQWQIIDHPLDGKPSVTFWRTVQEASCVGENGRSSTISLLELKPKTGRYRQLRRHMARVKGCPLVGDRTYGSRERGGGKLTFLQELGLFLCSTQISFEHPYYNASEGQKETDDLKDGKSRQCFGSRVQVACDSRRDRVLVHAKISLPEKFACLMNS